MIKIKYYTGKTTIEVEVTEEQAKEIARLNQLDDTGRKQVKRRWKLDEFIEERPSSEPTPEDKLVEKFMQQEQEELKARLRAAIKTLTAEQQEVINKVFVEEKSYAQVAKELGIGKQSAYDRVQVILKKLKKLLQK